VPLQVLGEVYRGEERLEEAAPLFERALSLLEKAFGPEHPRLLKTLNGLADVTRQKGDSGRAEALYRRSIGISDAAPDVVWEERTVALNSLALLYHARGQKEEAKQLLTRALAALERGAGPRHPGVARILVNLAAVCAETGQASYARSLYRRAADIDAALAAPLLARVSARPDRP
jgi:tetratricopeptide (TPR) repeat protein